MAFDIGGTPDGKLKLDAISTLGDYTVDGDYIFFGAYPRSKKADDVTVGDIYDKGRCFFLGSDYNLYAVWKGMYYRVEPIKWKSLYIGAEKFYVTEEIIDGYCFNDKPNNVDYARSMVRSWLNGEFYKTAFSKGQQAEILKTKVDNSAESVGEGARRLCFDTKDKVFLLSRYEAEQYMGIGENCKRVPTDYALARGIYYPQYNSGYDDNFKKDGIYCGHWWLRSPSFNNRCWVGEQYVEDRGRISYNEHVSSIYGIVPAIKIKL